jgi:hypothetical protein
MAKLNSQLLVFVACLALAGCGGGGAASKSRSSAAAASPGAATTPASAGARAKVTTGPVRGLLHAPDHAPVAGKGWPYTVKVTDPAGKPIPGTVEIKFLFAGQVVGHDTPPTHPLRHGTWRSILTFPTQAVGEPLTFRAMVHTNRGSITLDWPVDVRR